ncbi:flagellar basal body P-ring protein FlgI [Marispirochaeta aestuarii]|uniref:flagellar basal body P-ring protein FlgI n=1 Tax=Marispirochaeta aestuarii TaxID=1963862 RepID=UPI0029C6A720|nr:flagellar basal body P-ring protein FlgI [Marispirochaeta aestuarii]
MKTIPQKYKLILLAVSIFFLSPVVGNPPLFAQDEIRLREISVVEGFRENQLAGLGIVTGLAGKGDSQSSPLMRRFLANMVSNFAEQVSERDIRSKNSAVVLVTADLPAYVQPGERISVRVSSIGDAKSLIGGVLLQTALKGADGAVYAVAQGSIPGISGSSNDTVASLPGGGIMERAVNSRVSENGTVSILLKEPDFSTAAAVSRAIRENSEFEVAFADAARISVRIPEEYAERTVEMIAQLENLSVPPAFTDRVVVNPRTGVVVMGKDVRIGKVAVSYQGLKISIMDDDLYSDKESESFLIEQRPTVEDFVDLLREIGVDTKGLIEILQAVDHAGALYGTLEVM